MPLATNFSINLLQGEVVKVAGPGTLKFQAAEVVNTFQATQTTQAAGVIIGQKGAIGAGIKGAGAAGAIGTVGSGQGAGGAKSLSAMWGGKSIKLGLGLGLGLGPWGPVLLASALTVGGYAYWRKKQAEKLWPF